MRRPRRAAGGILPKSVRNVPDAWNISLILQPKKGDR